MQAKIIQKKEKQGNCASHAQSRPLYVYSRTHAHTQGERKGTMPCHVAGCLIPVTSPRRKEKKKREKKKKDDVSTLVAARTDLLLINGEG